MGIDYLEIDDKIIEIQEENGALVGLDFVLEKGEVNITKESNLIKKEIEEYFKGEIKEFTFNIDFLKGTDFQKSVWRAVKDIPYGETKSYKEIATMIGNPKASRAVGLANNKNPILIVIPCHRVIGSNGKLVGYRGGIELKKKLLNLEKLHK